MSTNTMSVHFLPPNATHLCQPADSFITKATKEMWTTEWDREKYRLAFFLKLAARCARAVSQKKNYNDVSYPRKAMILCGLSNNANGA
jgi:hypothetical protein